MTREVRHAEKCRERSKSANRIGKRNSRQHPPRVGSRRPTIADPSHGLEKAAQIDGKIREPYPGRQLPGTVEGLVLGVARRSWGARPRTT